MAPIRSALRILAEVMPSELAKLCSSGNSIPDRPPLRRRVPDAVAADGAVCSWVSVTVVSDPSEVARAQTRGAGVESRREAQQVLSCIRRAEPRQSVAENVLGR
jgi:hypothetical protein